jgi:protein SSD1
MLPPKIASDICSLTPGEDRLTVSVVFQVDPHTGIIDEEATWIGKSIIQSSGKLSYKDVDAILSGHNDIKIEGAEIKDIHILHVSTARAF